MGGAGQLLMLFTALGDTYPSKMQAKHQVASSDTVIYNEIKHFPSQAASGLDLAKGSAPGASRHLPRRLPKAKITVWGLALGSYNASQQRPGTVDQSLC